MVGGVLDVVGNSDALRHTPSHFSDPRDVSRPRRVTPRSGRDRDSLRPTMSFFQPQAQKAVQKAGIDPQHQPWVEK